MSGACVSRQGARNSALRTNCLTGHCMARKRHPTSLDSQHALQKESRCVARLHRTMGGHEAPLLDSASGEL